MSSKLKQAITVGVVSHNHTTADAHAHAETRRKGRKVHFLPLFTLYLSYTILLGPLQRAGGLRACRPLARHVSEVRVHACLVGTQPRTEGALG